ncbi:Phosphotransferase enzyme family protein [Aeromonas sp. RU39B]|uniref:phosphotransferase n=1 Tax=Aeromonas sp. RU39B TaxID=1907416 RepID=UPI00095418C4|nr:phosphotransferase [Aeromonas sp. RU39B]SIQ13813.1 Phosphotransferase enzyme family protein [Aeromonas sp. RU39B]
MNTIILSGQYVTQELQVEFGLIPPAFLPVGNRRLYEYQIANIKESASDGLIYLTLPKSYALSDWDKLELDRQHVRIIWVDEHFSLGQSISYVLASMPDLTQEVSIYYGDTLFRQSIECVGDAAFVAKPDHNYLWLSLGKDTYNDDKTVFCGYLKVCKPVHLIKALIQSNFDLESGLYRYHATYPIAKLFRSDWLDFGHLNTYFNSKTIVTTERAFNSLEITKNHVLKRSEKDTKLQAEALWFNSIPEELCHFTPRLISHGKQNSGYYYKLEYLYHPTLTELFVFGHQPAIVWERIIGACFDFVNSCRALNNTVNDLDDNFYPAFVLKNQERLESFLSDNPRYAKPIANPKGQEYLLRDILEQCHKLIDTNSHKTFVHGDLCFSNILFDFRKNDIKVIDPRGISFDGTITSLGDTRYDLAKLCHSAIGKYDLIVSDTFSVEDDGHELKLVLPDHNVDLSDSIRDNIEKMGFSFNEIMAMTCTLFLSMLPLHYDKPLRQQAFIATAIKLYQGIKK